MFRRILAIVVVFGLSAGVARAQVRHSGVGVAAPNGGIGANGGVFNPPTSPALQFASPFGQASAAMNNPVLFYNNPLNQSYIGMNNPALFSNFPTNQPYIGLNNPSLFYNNPLNQSYIGLNNPSLFYNNPLNQSYNGLNNPAIRFNSPTTQGGMIPGGANNPLTQGNIAGNGFNNPLTQGNFIPGGANNPLNPLGQGNANGFTGNGMNRSVQGNNNSNNFGNAGSNPLMPNLNPVGRGFSAARQNPSSASAMFNGSSNTRSRSPRISTPRSFSRKTTARKR